MKTELKKIRVHSFYVLYEKDAYEGIRYLRDDLDYSEARVFFEQARRRSEARFEDDEDRQYTLFYKSGTFTLVRR